MGRNAARMARPLAAFFLTACCAGCSFIAMRAPPPAPQPFNAQAVTECRDPWYPIADMVSTIAGVTWVVHANQRDEAEAHQNSYTSAGNAPFDTVSTDFLRAAGYTVIAVYGASTIYGFYVTGKCVQRKNEVAAAKEQRTQARAQEGSSRRAALPEVVGGFSFRIAPEEATRICLAAHHEWDARGSVAYCRPPAASTSAQLTRLEFELGSLARISVLHNPARDSFNQAYDEIFARMLAQFGAPQEQRAPLSDDCDAALPACLEQGAKPRGARWFWSEGNVAVAPIWLEGHAFIEERHARETSVPP
jgi:hypothetical protein